MSSYNVGIGTDTPLEKLHVIGGIMIGDTNNSINGIIRWTGTDFHGRKNNTWVSLTGIGLKGNTGTDGSKGDKGETGSKGEPFMDKYWVPNGNKLYYDANIGLGILDPLERLHTNGAIILGNASYPQTIPGTIRWNGIDFEGYKINQWVSLTNSSTENTNNSNSGNTTNTSGLFVSGDSSFSGNIGIGVTGQSLDGKLYIKADDINSLALKVDGKTKFSGHVIPSDNTYNLGEQLTAWNNIYSQSLYISGKKVIYDEGNITNISTTYDKNLNIKTTGSGNLQLISADNNIQLTAGNNIILSSDNVTVEGGLKLGAADDDAADGTIRVDDGKLEFKCNGSWFRVALATKPS